MFRDAGEDGWVELGAEGALEVAQVERLTGAVEVGGEELSERRVSLSEKCREVQIS